MKKVWFEIFEDMGEELGTRTIDTAPTVELAIIAQRKVLSDNPINIDKWKLDEVGIPQQVEMTAEEKKRVMLLPDNYKIFSFLKNIFKLK